MYKPFSHHSPSALVVTGGGIAIGIIDCWKVLFIAQHNYFYTLYILHNDCGSTMTVGKRSLFFRPTFQQLTILHISMTERVDIVNVLHEATATFLLT